MEPNLNASFATMQDYILMGFLWMIRVSRDSMSGRPAGSIV